MKDKTKQTNELNRKASAILRTLSDKQLEQVTGGTVISVGLGCPTCGRLTSEPA